MRKKEIVNKHTSPKFARPPINLSSNYVASVQKGTEHKAQMIKE